MQTFERVLIGTLIGLVIGYVIAMTMNYYDELKRRKGNARSNRD